MGYRIEVFAPGNIYHVFNRGVEKRRIFRDSLDRKRFVAVLSHCRPQDRVPSFSLVKRVQKQRQLSGQYLVDILCYCLMPNHFHLLLKENIEAGISHYMQKLLNSYSRYFNVRYKRVGPLFSGRFRAVGIEGDDQFLHITRYIHLNPYVAGLCNNPLSRAWSSLDEYMGKAPHGFCQTDLLLELVTPQDYKNFVVDHADYAKELEFIKHLALDDE